MVVIMIGRKRSRQASIDRVARARAARVRSASSAKSIIMIAFFFTMPISRMMPISAMTLNSVVEQHQREQRADAGRRQRGQDRDRMHEALVEHAEHDVDRQPAPPESASGWLVSEAWNARAVPWKLPLDAWPARRSRASRCVDRVATASRQRHARRQVEREVIAANWPWWFDRERRVGRSVAANADERHLRAGRED